MATSTEAPGRLPVAINGHLFLADANIIRRTVPVIRQQADTSTEAGEQTLNPQGLWRRSQESWHHGAGQDFLDGRQGDEATDPHRFRSSKGVDVWTRGQVSLLRPTMKVFDTAFTNLHMATVRDASSGQYRLFLAAGSALWWNQLPYGLGSAIQSGGGWTATNGTIGAGVVRIGWFRITATASASVSATSPVGTSAMPVQAGRRYGFVFGSVNISGSGAKIPRVNVNWYDAGGTLISSTTPVVASGNDASLQAVVGDATAPANAAFVSITVGYTANLTSGDIHEGIANIGPYENVDVPSAGFPDIWNYEDIFAGQPASDILSLASDGATVWAALSTSGIHRYSTVTGTTIVADVPAAPASGQVHLVGYANGFLLAAGSAGVSSSRRNSLWLVNDPLGTPALSLIKTHPNTGFEWTFISPGRGCVYAGGNSGGNGEVYKILFDPNTGTLSSAASFATYLPEGETVHALAFYAGGIIMGTGKGLRIGQADGAGNIDYGPLIETDWPVRCLEPQDRYCWFGWTKYDDDTSGLGRIDLGFLTDTLTPAWASDLMTSDTSSGDVVSCVTFAPYGYTADQRPPVRVFSVAGEGVYIEDPSYRVAEGSFATGAVRFSTSEPKQARSVDLRHHALPPAGDIEAEIQVDDSGNWTSLGSSTTTGSYGPAAPLDATATAEAEATELRITLNRPDPDGTDFSRSPELTRWTLKALPLPSTIDETFEIPLVMRRAVQTNTNDGIPYHIDVEAEIAYLKGLERSRELIDVQIGNETITNCFVLGSEFRPDQWGPGREFLEGTYVLQISTARG